MASNTDYLPDEITYGFVADRVLLAVGDTASDDNRFPDGVPAQGTVRFSPERTILYTQETPATVLPQDIECTIYHRDHPVAVNNGYEPELVGKLVDPAGHVGNVALIVGWYEAVYRLETGTAQRFRFKVLPEHTADNPLWLPSVAPLTPTPSERFVVNEQVYNDTKEARDEAVDAAETAVEARTGAETAETNAGTHATASATSASTAADILAASQALGITVDTSVGTRVFVGDTMIHGDTGTRNISESLLNGWTGSSLRIQRQNNMAYITIDGGSGILNGTQSTDPAFVSLPVGFRPDAGGYAFVGWIQNADTHEPEAIRKEHSRLTTTTKGRIYGVISYKTADSWPTSLPGNPV